MASTSKSNGSGLVKSLAAYKRKVRDNDNLVNDKRTKYWEDSDDEPLIPSVLVRVEVEELEEPGSPLDFSASKKGRSSTAKQPKASKRSRHYTCLECSAVFKRAPDLKAHAVEHQIETRHKCETCGRCFSRAFSLKMHLRVHVKDEKCPFCDLTFALRVNLNRHLVRSHDPTEQCDQCSEKFHTKELLEKHMASHAAGSSLQESGDSENGETHNTQNQSSESDYEGNSDKEILPNTHPQDDTLMTNNDNSNDPLEYKPDVADMFINHELILTPDGLTSPTKYAIVSKMQKGKLVPDLCKQYNTTPDVVNAVWEDREIYSIPKQQVKKTTKYMNSVLDKQILEWYNGEKARNVQVTGKILQDTAEKFAQESGFVAFNPSKKWLERFKKRYNIQFRPPNLNRDYHAIESKWKTLFFKEQWPDARGGIADEDIYTADEIGLFYNPSKGRIRKYGGRRYVQGYVKDRLSVFMCTNVNGMDKKKLLVCGSEDPLVHSYRDPSSLPVMYIRHSQAQFTTRIFEEYVKFWNRELQLMNRRAMLLLDRATIHSKLQLSHLKLVFVPWKSNANSLMPVKNGIFTTFRDEFKRQLLQEKAMNVVRGVDRNLTCLEALTMLEKAWNRIPPDVIFKSFVNIGYDVQNCKKNDAVVYTPKITENDAEAITKMLRDYDVETYFTDLLGLDMYLTVDDELLTGQGTNVSVFGGNRKPILPGTSKQVPIIEVDDDILPLNTEKPESEKTEMVVRRIRALDDLNIVRDYLQSNSTSYDTFCSFMDVEKYLLNTNFNVL